MTDIDKPTDAEPKGNALTLGAVPNLDEYACASGSQPYLDYEPVKATDKTSDGTPAYQYISSSDEGTKGQGIAIAENYPPTAPDAGYGAFIHVHVLCPPANGADQSGVLAKPALTGALRKILFRL